MNRRLDSHQRLRWESISIGRRPATSARLDGWTCTNVPSVPNRVPSLLGHTQKVVAPIASGPSENEPCLRAGDASSGFHTTRRPGSKTRTKHVASESNAASPVLETRPVPDGDVKWRARNQAAADCSGEGASQRVRPAEYHREDSNLSQRTSQNRVPVHGTMAHTKRSIVWTAGIAPASSWLSPTRSPAELRPHQSISTTERN